MQVSKQGYVLLVCGPPPAKCRQIHIATFAPRSSNAASLALGHLNTVVFSPPPPLPRLADQTLIPLLHPGAPVTELTHPTLPRVVDLHTSRLPLALPES